MKKIAKYVIGLRTKFVALVSVVLVCIFGLFAILMIQSNSQNLRNNLYDEAKAFSALTTPPVGNTFAIYKDSGRLKIDQAVREAAGLNNSITNISIVDINGEIHYSQNKDMTPQVNKADAESFEPVYLQNNQGTIETIVYPYFEASGAHRFSVVYSVSDQEIELVVRRDTMSSISFALLALFITAVSIYLLINLLIIRPVESVSEQAEIISNGNLDQQITVRSNDEIGSLSQSVNKMANSLKQNIAELQEVDKVKSEFMMITSHNLRTPLTIISGYMENAELFANDPEKMNNIIVKISTSVKRLEMFAEDVLTISRFELGEQIKEDADVDLAVFLDRITMDFKKTAESKKIEFSSNYSGEKTRVAISAPHLRSAIWNILDNSLKFTKEGGKIELFSEVKDNTAIIKVIDNGIGISKEELPKLFTKFHRGTSTLVYDFGGTGIGLYSSKVMIENYGGSITAESELDKGSTFTITLPLVKGLSE